MINVAQVEVDGEKALGLKVGLPNSPPLLLIVGKKGFVMCGYLNIDAAERLQAAAAVVSGVRSFDDVLKAEVKAVTSRAQEYGVNVGIKGKDALKRFI